MIWYRSMVVKVRLRFQYLWGASEQKLEKSL